jgi:hypothetical protein
MGSKILKFITFLFAILAPVLCKAAIFTEDGMIGPGYNEPTEIKNLANVNMIGGNSNDVWIRDYGLLNFSDGTILHTRVENMGTMNLVGSSFENIELHGSAKFNIQSGVFQGQIFAWDSSKTNINGGQVQEGWLEARQYTVTNMYGGNIAWDQFNLWDYAIANIYEGTIHFNGAFGLRSFTSLNVFGGEIVFDIPVPIMLDNSATLNIYGGGSAILSNGFNLLGNSGINVYYTNTIYNKPGGRVIGYNLADGSQFMLNLFTQTEISQINFVPEPASIFLFGLGGLFLGKRK